MEEINPSFFFMYFFFSLFFGAVPIIYGITQIRNIFKKL